MCYCLNAFVDVITQTKTVNGFTVLYSVASIGVFVFTALSYRQNAKFFGYQNRVIPKIEVTEDFRIRITNRGKSFLTNLKGSHRFVHEQGGNGKVITEGKFFSDFLETDEITQFAPNFKYEKLVNQSDGYLFIIIVLESTK